MADSPGPSQKCSASPPFLTPSPSTLTAFCKRSTSETLPSKENSKNSSPAPTNCKRRRSHRNSPANNLFRTSFRPLPVCKLLAQFYLLEFAHARPRNRFHEHYRIRQLPLRKFRRQKLPQLFRRCRFSRLQNHRCQRPFLPLRMRQSHHARLFHRRMPHQKIFQIHRTDPLPARFHQILRPVNQPHIALFIHRRHVARSKPSVRRPPVRLIRRLVIFRRNPRPAYFQFARRRAVPRTLQAFRHRLARREIRAPHHAQFDKRSRPSLLASHFVLFVRGPVPHVLLQRSKRRQRRRFRHSPQMNQPNAKFIQPANQLFRRRRSAARQPHRPRKFPSRRIRFQRLQHAHPHRWHAARKCHSLLHHQIQNAFRVHVRSRQHQPCAHHRARVRQSPRICEKHGHHRQYRVAVAQPHRIHHRLRERVQHQRAVRIDHALRTSRRARRKTHRRAVILFDLRQRRVRRSIRDQLFIIQKSVRHLAASVRHHNYFFEWRFRSEFLQHRQQHIVDNQKPVLRVPRNRRYLLRMQTQIQRVQNSARARHAKKRLQMSAVIPHHRSHPVPRPHSHFDQRGSQPPRSPVEISVARPHNRSVRPPRNNFNLRKKFAVARENMLQRQRKIHHRSAHAFLAGSKLSRIVASKKPLRAIACAGTFAACPSQKIRCKSGQFPRGCN